MTWTLHRTATYANPADGSFNPIHGEETMYPNEQQEIDFSAINSGAAGWGGASFSMESFETSLDGTTLRLDYNAVLWGVEQGIVKGTSETTFSPDATVTRGQTVTFQWRAAGLPAPGADNPFTDLAPNAYYHDAVLWAVAENITNGMTPTAFGPDELCTRGQIVTMLHRDLG